MFNTCRWNRCGASIRVLKHIIVWSSLYIIVSTSIKFHCTPENFTAPRSRIQWPARIGNTPLPVEESTKFLGLWWDSHLSFKKHIRALKTECKDLNLIRVVAHLKWGGDRDTLLMLYRTNVCSKLDYGCILYGTALNTNVRQLDSIHNVGLRLAHGAFSWWRYQMETFSALLALCAGNSLVSGEFPAQRPVTRSINVFFDLSLNKRSSKHWWGWWFQTQSCSLWRHCNVHQPSFQYVQGGQWRSFGRTSVRAVHASENSYLHRQPGTSCPTWIRPNNKRSVSS